MTTALSDAGVMFADGSVQSAVLRGHLFGCTLSTAGSSATMSVSAGQFADSTNMIAASLTALAKTTAAWAVGTAAGGLDTGAIAINSWYHFYAIRRPDTGVVDVVFSLSATAPTLPAGYTQFRRIGSGFTNASLQWTAFFQAGDLFQWLVPIGDVAATAPGAVAVLRTLSVPTGVSVDVRLSVGMNTGVISESVALTDPTTTDTAMTGTYSQVGATLHVYASGGSVATCTAQIRTNTSGQIRTRNSVGGATVQILVTTFGWIDTRGRNA